MPEACRNTTRRTKKRGFPLCPHLFRAAFPFSFIVFLSSFTSSSLFLSLVSSSLFLLSLSCSVLLLFALPTHGMDADVSRNFHGCMQPASLAQLVGATTTGRLWFKPGCPLSGGKTLPGSLADCALSIQGAVSLGDALVSLLLHDVIEGFL